MRKDEELLTLQQVAAWLKVPVTTIYQWRYRGEVLVVSASAATCGIAGRMWRSSSMSAWTHVRPRRGQVMASIQKRPDGKWRARYRDPDKREHAKHFARKIDAQRWLTAVEADMLRGSYVDPNAGKISLRRFAESWLAAQTFDPSTREAVASRLRVHVLPILGDLELRAIRPSAVQAWLRGRQQEAAPTYVRVMLANLSAMLGAAVEDGLIARNPCQARAVKAPALGGSRVQPWPTERVLAVADALPARYRATAVVAGGVGLRQGGVFGLAVEGIDFLRGWIHVRRQVKLLNSRLVFAPPKGGRYVTYRWPSRWPSSFLHTSRDTRRLRSHCLGRHRRASLTRWR